MDGGQPGESCSTQSSLDKTTAETKQAFISSDFKKDTFMEVNGLVDRR